MAEQTGISWADATFNPWLGCQKVSPACDFCYAETLCTTRLGVAWGPHADRRRTAASTWANIPRWNRHPERLDAPAGTKPFVFGGSLCDVFDNAVDPAWRRDYFDAIRAAENLVFLLLTKRPQNIDPMVEAAGGLPPNVALGTTIEDRPRAQQNLRALLRPRAVHPLFYFASCEPLLADISDIVARYIAPGTLTYDGRQGPWVSWVIAGGESGDNARPSDPTWFRNLEKIAAVYGATFHFKQVGGRGRNKGGDRLDGRLIRGRPFIPAEPPLAPPLPLVDPVLL